jgi:hypothetical protein
MSDIHEKTQCQSISERSRTFGEAVSIGISVLVQQLGYSQTRAADAILHVITGSNCELDDDKVSKSAGFCRICTTSVYFHRGYFLIFCGFKMSLGIRYHAKIWCVIR